MSYFLALNASKGVQLALFKENSGSLIPIVEETKATELTDDLVINISNCLQKAQLNIKDISVIALSLGPGFFTGIRNGIVVAKMFKLALNIPVIGLRTSEVLAFANSLNKDTGSVVSCINIGKPGAAVSLYSEQKMIMEDTYVSELEINSFINTMLGRYGIEYAYAVGEKQNLLNLKQIGHTEINSVSLHAMAILAKKKLEQGNYTNSLSPIYSNQPDIWKSGQNGNTK